MIHPYTNYFTVSKILRTERLNHNLSFRSFAEELNAKYKLEVSKSALSTYEKGQTRLKIEILFALIDYFDLNESYIKHLILKSIKK
ncbi:helix-turn-helix domain-containing protein [Loigolactobacillus backii]|uniref:helix-turn-helix domain-containing protein n=1 Tax=Loigolactobacillus backii TaxID=375175 RepID=UPI0009EE9F52